MKHALIKGLTTYPCTFNLILQQYDIVITIHEHSSLRHVCIH